MDRVVSICTEKICSCHQKDWGIIIWNIVVTGLKYDPYYNKCLKNKCTIMIIIIPFSHLLNMIINICAVQLLSKLIFMTLLFCEYDFIWVLAKLNDLISFDYERFFFYFNFSVLLYHFKIWYIMVLHIIPHHTQGEIPSIFYILSSHE